MHKMSLPMVKAYTSIYNKETRARIENLQPSELLVDKNGTHNVKIYADYFTKHRQNGGHQRKTRNAGANLSKQLRCSAEGIGIKHGTQEHL